MEEFDPQKIRQAVDKLIWYHTLNLGHNVFTPGVYDHHPYLHAYGFPKNLAGLTGLDIGAASGFFTFELERRGAQMTSTELPQWLAHDFGPQYGYEGGMNAVEAEHYLHEPFLFAHKILKSKANRRIINIYDITPESVGTFDIVFCGSVLLHLTDPAKALQRIQSITKGVAIVATAIYPLQLPEPLALFAGEPNGTIWWHPNRTGFEALIKSAGFKGWEWFSEFRLDYRSGEPGPYHAVIRAWNTPERPLILNDTDQPSSDLVKFAIDPFDSTQQLIDSMIKEKQHLQSIITKYESMKYIQLVRWFHPYRQKINALLGLKND